MRVLATALMVLSIAAPVAVRAAEGDAAAAEPTTAKGWFQAGHQKMESGDLDGAVAAFQKAKEMCRADNKKDRAWAMNNVGLCHIKAEKWDEARSALEEATGLDESNAKAWNNLGTVLMQGGDHAKAVSAFEAALKAKPDYASAKANLAYAKNLAESSPAPAAAPKEEAKPAEEKPAETTAPAGESKP